MVIVSENGDDLSYYEGEFFGGKPSGKGVKCLEDKTKIEGYWVGGKFFEGQAPPGILEK